MSDVNIIQLNSADDEDQGFLDFIESVKSENESVVFMINRKDGNVAVGSTYKDVKELVWDIERLKMFVQDLIRNSEE